MDLVTWLEDQLRDLGWTQAELARRASVSQAQVSFVLNGQRRAGADFCIAIAGALKEEPSYVLKLAGYLPASYNPKRDLLTRLLEAAASLPDDDLEELLAVVGVKRGRANSGSGSVAPQSGGA
jgi:transcriptional regulator with XRE-family HTH domain